MRNDVSADDIKDAYLLSWETNCKGITVFRDGCKDLQVLNVGIKGKEEGKKIEPTIERPYRVVGATYKMHTPVGTAFVTINEDGGGQPLEVFINVGKAGSDVTAMAEALGRTISTILRFRGDLSPKDRAKTVSEQLIGIGGRRSVGFGPNKIRSLPDAIATALANHFGFKILNGNGKHIINGNGKAGAKADLAGPVMVAARPSEGQTREGIDDPTTVSAESSSASESKKEPAYAAPAGEFYVSKGADICPSCGATSLIYEEGCVKCYVCGHSEC